jgi:signal transduction histidine kinase
MFGDPIDEDVPAVIAPIVDVEAAPEGRAPRRQGGFELLGYTVVQLDRDYIHDELLPSLERRFFDPADGFDYWLRVSSSREPRRAIYESRDALATHREAPDASAVILDVRLDPQNRDLIDGADPALASAWRRRLGMDGRAALAGRRPLPLVRRPGGRRADDPGRWQVALWNRAGGLAEVVTIARRRNLAVGFGILVLLGASVALLVATARRAERLARQQMEFVAGVTHELRTPLAVIRSAGENLADGLVADASQVRSYGALVRDEGRRLTEMVEQVLALAGAESGRPPAPPKPVRVRSLVDAVLASCEAEIRAAGVTVDTDVPEGLPSVLGDEAALRRALRNLLDNAVKYAGDSSWIGVRARAGRGERGPEVSLTVQDRGLGVAQEDLPRIFEPFYRGREAVDRQIHGSGLGLSLVRRIAESHGGRITVETGRETGSSFTLRLPVAPEEAPQRASAEQAREEANPAR